jgi:transcription elongation factor/antiterminator RfaH
MRQLAQRYFDFRDVQGPSQTGGSKMTAANDTCWYVIHTHPRQEERAQSNLEQWQLTTFLPRWRDRRYNGFSGDISYVVKPLFPRYLFARFNLNEVYNRIRFTRGVHSIVTFAGAPCPVEDEIIELIQLQAGADGLVRIGGDSTVTHGTEFKPGDRVIIREGPLRRLTGVFERELTDAERVAVLLDSVSFQVRVVAERHTLERVC